MHKLALALVFVLTSFGVAQAAGAKVSSARPVKLAPTAATLKRYLATAEKQYLKSAQALRITKAVRANPENFERISLGAKGPHHGHTAFIPKTPVKGLPGNTAFIRSLSRRGPRFTIAVALPES